MTAKKGGAPAKNQNARTHGLKSARTVRGRYIRRSAELKAEALSLKPDLSPPMIRLYISIQLNLIALDSWAESHQFVNSRGQVARFAEEQDRQRGRFLEWCRINNLKEEQPKRDPIADIMAGIQRESWR